MADLRYTAELQDKISPSLKNIQSEVTKVSQAFINLREKIATISFGAMITSAVQFAAAIDDVATSSGMAVEAVLGITKSFAQFGGSTESAITGIARFQNAVSDAASGNKQAQENFTKLGISLNDLGTLSEQDLFRKTIAGLAQLGPGAERTALAMTILGKSAANIDFNAVNNGLDATIAKSRASADAIRTAAEAEERFGQAMDTFKISLLAALEPIARFFNGLDPKAVEDFMKAIVELGKAFAIFFVIDKASSIVKNLSTALTAAGSTGNGFATAMGNIAKATTGGTSSFGTLTTGVKNLGFLFANLNVLLGGGNGLNSVLSSLMRNFGRIGAGLAGLAAVGAKVYFIFEALNAVSSALTGNSLTDWAERAAKALGLISETSKEIADANKAESDKLAKLADAREKERQQLEKKREVQAWFQEALDKERAKLNEAVGSYQAQTEEQRKKFDLQTRLMRMSEEQALVEQSAADAQENYLKAIQPLLAQAQAIRDKGAKANDLERAQLPEIEGAIRRITEEFNKQEPLRQAAVSDRIKEMLAVKEMAYWQEVLTKSTERKQAVDEALNEILLRGPREAKERTDEYLNGTLSPLEAQLRRIAQEENKLKEAILKRLAVQFQNADGELIDAEGYAKAVSEVEAATRRNIEILSRQAQEQAENSRKFSTGWNKAFREYRDAATNAAQTAQRVFSKATQGLEDLFVNFAKTGKFEWKKFVNDLGEEILRSQLKQIIGSVFGSLTDAMEGGSGFLGAIGNLLGMGNSGSTKGSSATNPLYVLDISSGSAGGYSPAMRGGNSSGGGFFDSLFGGIKSVVGGISDAIGGIFNGGFGTGNDYGNLDFGGFFANGGVIPKGKYGIVGERGPEYALGPAAIMPMTGSTNVTYNINAVDAQSFKSMIAADPSFIHAVAMQGGKGLARRY